MRTMAMAAALVALLAAAGPRMKFECTALGEAEMRGVGEWI